MWNLSEWLENLPDEQEERIRFWVRRAIILGSIVLFVLLGTLALAFETLITTRSTIQLQVGDVVSRDILAPRSLAYSSDVLTQLAQQDAIQKVQPVYDPNPDVTREQIRQARAITTYINEVRHDTYATPQERIEDLLVIEDLTLSEDLWENIISTPDSRWDLISNEISALLERTMQRDIRPDNLESTRNALFNSVASRFSNSEAEIIVAVTEDLIQANTFFNEEQTLARQNEAAAAVPIQERRFEKGQLIVRSGNIMQELDMEALRQFGFLQSTVIEVQALVGGLLAIIMATLISGLYLDRFHPALLRDRKMLPLLAGLFLIFLASVNLFGRQPYLYPAAALGLLLTSLYSPQLAIMASSFLAVLVGITQPNDFALPITVYVLIGSISGILSLRRTERLNSYFMAGIIISAVNLVMVIALALSADDTPSMVDVLFSSILALGNGLFAAAIALLGLYIVTSLLNLPTSLKMLELQDYKQPLLQQLLRDSPGTYQHSLQVANLCVPAAEAIGADVQLIRVAAMYHDIGKMMNPYYFAENTAEGMNPHDDLNDPYQSAKIIIGHVIEGERMARRANLPQRIRDFILEHHGTTQVLYFYNQALERANNDEAAVDIRDFTYPGPTPRSCETAIMMLADGCESATRSRRPSSKAEIEETVNTIFELRLGEGQLDDSGLTLNDLKTIRSIFIQTLQAMYHPRIAYKMRKKIETNQHQQLTNGIVKHLEHETEKRPDPKPPNDDIRQTQIIIDDNQ